MDTTGAGDTFAAGFLREYCVSQDAARSLARGCGGSRRLRAAGGRFPLGRLISAHEQRAGHAVGAAPAHEELLGGKGGQLEAVAGHLRAHPGRLREAHRAA